MTPEVQQVLAGERRHALEASDCIAFLDSLPPNSVDLVFGSPPYMDARTYGIDAVYDCQDWVNWMLRVTEAAIRVSKGLVLWVAAGVQRDLCYWPGCEGLMWEWWKRGNQLWRPCIWWKVDANEGGSGIPGSGGKQWLRNDWEYVMAFKKAGWLPWADNTVMGEPPVIAEVGGAMSNRTADGRRTNDRLTEGGKRRSWTGQNRRQNGEYKEAGNPMPKLANPGNCIIVKARVGGGHMGSRLCHENEAPFPEDLAEFFVRSFCPPDGICCDVFAGSGTTAAICIRAGRRFVGCDLRPSQVELATRRISGETPPLPGIESGQASQAP